MLGYFFYTWNLDRSCCWLRVQYDGLLLKEKVLIKTCLLIKPESLQVITFQIYLFPPRKKRLSINKKRLQLKLHTITFLITPCVFTKVYVNEYLFCKYTLTRSGLQVKNIV